MQIISAMALLGVVASAWASDQMDDAAVPMTGDNLVSCFRPDNTTSYYVEVGQSCAEGDRIAIRCYRPDGSSFGVEGGAKGFMLSCRDAGGSVFGPNPDQ
jgi:hypothetical protein